LVWRGVVAKPAFTGFKFQVGREGGEGGSGGCGWLCLSWGGCPGEKCVCSLTARFPSLLPSLPLPPVARPVDTISTNLTSFPPSLPPSLPT
jgi:hypothetical protein